MGFNTETYYALLILLELADVHPDRGCLLSDMAHKHKVPIEELTKAMMKLELANFITVKRGYREWLFLVDEPSKLRVINVIELFDNSSYLINTDRESGRVIQSNNMLRFLEERKREIESPIRSCWFNVTLERLHQMKRMAYF